MDRVLERDFTIMNDVVYNFYYILTSVPEAYDSLVNSAMFSAN